MVKSYQVYTGCYCGRGVKAKNQPQTKQRGEPGEVTESSLKEAKDKERYSPWW